jgi:hypothetical protein
MSRYKYTHPPPDRVCPPPPVGPGITAAGGSTRGIPVTGYHITEERGYIGVIRVAREREMKNSGVRSVLPDC